MKKQLLAAAVAATMASVATADISITGAAKVNYTYSDKDDSTSSNAFKNEMDLKVKGTHGDTTVVMNFANDTTGTTSTILSEDNYVSTKVGDVSIKVGDWDNGNNALRASSRGQNKFAASTSVGGVTMTYDAAGDAAGESVKLATTVAGVNVSYKAVSNGTAASNGEDIALSTTVGGVNVSYLALNRDGTNNSRDVIEISGEVAGMGVKFAQANAEANATIEGDTWMGDFEGNSSTVRPSYDLSPDQDVQSIEISTSMGGNTVKFRNTQIDGKTDEDTSFNSIILTRPLANGTTFEATYTALDDDAVSNEADTLDLELAVKF